MRSTFHVSGFPALPIHAVPDRRHGDCSDWGLKRSWSGKKKPRIGLASIRGFDFMAG
jgi:hypothetical protein